ncbi:MAG: DUF2378 family protein [Archangium sp.]|nr:DUF2378 family protein [Archangium sp.]
MAANPIPPEQRLVFSASVNGLLRILGDDVDKPEVRAKLLELGFNVDRLLPGYGLPECMKLMDYIGTRCFPELQGDERERALGRGFIRAFGETLLGKATMAMGKVMGPMRATMRLTRAMRTVNNYSNSGATQLTPRSVELWCEPVWRPWYYIGIFEEGGRAIHGESYTVVLRSFDEKKERAEFFVSW